MRSRDGRVGRHRAVLGRLQRALFAALHQRVREQGLVNEYYEAAFQQIIDEGTTLYGVDIGSMYATEIDTIEDLMAANARLAAAPRLRRPRRRGPPGRVS